MVRFGRPSTSFLNSTMLDSTQYYSYVLRGGFDLCLRVTEPRLHVEQAVHVRGLGVVLQPRCIDGKGLIFMVTVTGKQRESVAK